MSQSENYQHAMDTINDIADQNARNDVREFLKKLKSSYRQILKEHPHIQDIREELKLPFKDSVDQSVSHITLEFRQDGDIYFGNLDYLLVRKSRRYQIRELVQKINDEK